jgi:hypothetical protein
MPFFRFVLALLVLPALLASCSDSPSEPAPPSSKDPATVEQVAGLMDDAYDALLDQASRGGRRLAASEIVAALRVPGVQDISLDDSGLRARVVTASGEAYDQLLVNWGDDRLFRDAAAGAMAASAPSSVPSAAHSMLAAAASGEVAYPKSKRALLLLPFQWEFKERYDLYVALLENAGYQVDVFLNEQATLNRFRGDFLSRYGIVYISSHGSPVTTGDNRLGPNGETDRIQKLGHSVGVLTGETWTEDRYESLSRGEHLHLPPLGAFPKEPPTLPDGTKDLKGRRVFEVTPTWMLATGAAFPGTYLFVNSCNSMDIGKASRVAFGALLGAGASGVTGWTGVVNVRAANHIAAHFFSTTLNGINVEDASAEALALRLPHLANKLFWLLGRDEDVQQTDVRKLYRTVNRVPRTYLSTNLSGRWSVRQSCSRFGVEESTLDIDHDGDRFDLRGSIGGEDYHGAFSLVANRVWLGIPTPPHPERGYRLYADYEIELPKTADIVELRGTMTNDDDACAAVFTRQTYGGTARLAAGEALALP